MTLEDELRSFNPELLDRQRLVVGSKSDAAERDRRTALRRAAKARGLDYYEISSATRDGIDRLLQAIRGKLAAIEGEG